MSFYLDLSLIRTTETERVSALVESDALREAVSPLSDFGGPSVQALVFTSHSGWTVVAAGVGYSVAFCEQASRTLGTDAIAIMVSDCVAANLRLFQNGEETFSHEVGEAYGTVSPPDEEECLAAIHPWISPRFSRDSAEFVVSELDLMDQDSLGDLLELVGIPASMAYGPPEDIDHIASYGLPAIAAIIR
ncbi:MAG: hypothetical protein KDA80_04340 [Planctomycetaceae bacterium]|nr:hypothetical protein [Planctomycetaceae bacterium]